MPFFGGGSTPVLAPPVVVSGSGTYWLGDAAGNVLLALSDNTNVTTSDIDFGFPAVRAITIGRPDANGTIDTSQWYGARTVTWTGAVLGGVVQRDAFVDQVSGLCDPSLRLYLYANRPGWSQIRRVLLRADNLAAPRVVDQKVQITWIGVDGTLESAALSQAVLSGSAISGVFTISAATLIQGGVTVSGPPQTGITFPLSFPITFQGNQAAAGISTVTNNGTTATPPTFEITGPCSAPKIGCITTAASLSWPGLTLAEGETLVVDVRETSSLLGGAAAAWESPDWSVSKWPWVPKGTSQWQCTTATSGVGFEAVMNWRDRWL